VTTVQMNKGTQLVCAWAGIAFTVLFLIGFAVAGFITPPSPDDDPLHVAQMYAENRYFIRAGLLIATVSSALLALWISAIGVQMRRIEGRFSPLAFAQMLSGACLIVEFLFPLLFWQTAAYRGGRSPQLVQMLNDLGWLPFLGIACSAVMQGLVIGAVILRDQRPTPLFPRWAGYFNIWVVLMFAPASLVVLVHDGPLAWNGIISWWLAVIAFFLWMVGNTWVLIKAVNRDDYEAHDEVPSHSELIAEVRELRDRLNRLAIGQNPAP